MFTDIQLLQIKNTVMKILHIPGGYTGGVLEMAVVADYHISRQELTESCMQIANTLRKQEEIFRNVRLNLIKWIGDDCIRKEISSFSALQLGRAFADWEQQIPNPDKSLDELFRQLKLFYARSKVIILLTDGSYCIEETKPEGDTLDAR